MELVSCLPTRLKGVAKRVQMIVAAKSDISLMNSHKNEGNILEPSSYKIVIIGKAPTPQRELVILLLRGGKHHSVFSIWEHSFKSANGSLSELWNRNANIDVVDMFSAGIVLGGSFE